MAVYVSNITIPIGTDFQQTYFLEDYNNAPLDLTGYTGTSLMKKHPSSMTVAATFNVSFPDRLNGKIKISLGSTETLNLKPGRYLYDILVNSGTTKSRVIEGSAIVTAGVTT